MTDRARRDSLAINIRAADADTGDVLGHVSDLSVTGLSISASGDAPASAPAALTLTLPFSVNGLAEVTMAVEERWQKYDSRGRWLAGYRIVSCSDDGMVALEQLAARFSA